MRNTRARVGGIAWFCRVGISAGLLFLVWICVFRFLNLGSSWPAILQLYLLSHGWGRKRGGAVFASYWADLVGKKYFFNKRFWLQHYHDKVKTCVGNIASSKWQMTHRWRTKPRRSLGRSWQSLGGGETQRWLWLRNPSLVLIQQNSRTTQSLSESCSLPKSQRDLSCNNGHLLSSPTLGVSSTCGGSSCLKLVLKPSVCTRDMWRTVKAEDENMESQMCYILCCIFPPSLWTLIWAPE